jgi:hypothetical protein
MTGRSCHRCFTLWSSSGITCKGRWCCKSFSWQDVVQQEAILPESPKSWAAKNWCFFLTMAWHSAYWFSKLLTMLLWWLLTCPKAHTVLWKWPCALLRVKYQVTNHIFVIIPHPSYSPTLILWNLTCFVGWRIVISNSISAYSDRETPAAKWQ